MKQGKKEGDKVIVEERQGERGYRREIKGEIKEELGRDRERC